MEISSIQKVKQGIDSQKEAASPAKILSKNTKVQIPGKKLPKRGAVKKAIFRDIRNTIKGCANTLKNSCAPVHIRGERLVSENGKQAHDK